MSFEGGEGIIQLNVGFNAPGDLVIPLTKKSLGNSPGKDPWEIC
jgi:hypothetical protein